MSAPGGGAAKADTAISRQQLMDRLLITIPGVPLAFVSRQARRQMEVAGAKTGPQAARDNRNVWFCLDIRVQIL